MLNKNIKRIHLNWCSGDRKYYGFRNKKGEYVEVEISDTECNPKDKNCNPNLWIKHGLIKKPIYHYLNCTVYVKTNEMTIEKYNPCIKGTKINFDWLLEATKSNEIKILNEVYRRANLQSPSERVSKPRTKMHTEEIKKRSEEKRIADGKKRIHELLAKRKSPKKQTVKLLEAQNSTERIRRKRK